MGTPIGNRPPPSSRIIRAPLDLFDEAIDYVENYIDYLEMELAPEQESHYLHDADVDFDWSLMQVTSLEVAVDLIRDVTARLELRQAARSGQERATEAEP